MRKAQKKQADRILELLEQVHKGIRQTIQAGQKAEAVNYLSQCQDAAISLGESIEQTEGEGFVTVTFLEEYCEIVYQIYEKLQQGQEIPAEKSYKHLHKALVKIKNSVNHDIKLRMEAVFLPYKASMWDSLESVWKAADEDPDCDTYVVPIPYYDKNPDGTFREVHCEENLYPDYVPVTHYENYDFAERRPDMIFIHNPYDDCNYVTSVHPFFYSRNLKQYTEKLIYIPYFILGEVDPENAAAVKGIEHFCTVPAVLHADKVIVQSEDMRTVYVNVMTEFAKENGLKGMDRKYWEEKIDGSGSPKVDKVLRTKKEELNIPEDWRKIIEKPDRSIKKIVFYNTGITALLQHNEQMLEKMESVFQTFRVYRNDVALLWRPHPLMESTLTSMRPELWEKYRRLRDRYREEGWGIYDDTADMDRAVVLSDVYYGDMSSIVQLYQKTGKPVILQQFDLEVEVGFDQKTKQIRHMRWPNIRFTARYEDKLIGIPANYNAILSINLNNGNVAVKGKLLDEEMECYLLVVDIKRWHSYLIPSPFSAKNLHVYDVSKNDDIVFEQKFENKKINRLEASVSVVTDQYVYFLPSSGKMMLKLDMKNMTTCQIKNFHDEYLRIFNKDYETFTQGGVYEYCGKLYVALYEEGYIGEFFCETEHWNYYRIEEAPKGFMHLAGVDDKLFVLSRDHKLIQWCIIERKTESVYEISLDASKKIDSMQVSIYNCGEIYYLAPGDSWGIKYDISRNQLDVDYYENMWGLDVESGEKYRYTSYDGKGNIFLISNKNHIYMVDIVRKKSKRITLKLSFDDIDKLFANGEFGKKLLSFDGKKSIRF